VARVFAPAAHELLIAGGIVDNWVHIPFEEAKMRRQFGAAYDDYVAWVRRWV